MICPDCKGRKFYVGLNKTEPCHTCKGTGSLPDAIASTKEPLVMVPPFGAITVAAWAKAETMAEMMTIEDLYQDYCDRMDACLTTLGHPSGGIGLYTKQDILDELMFMYQNESDHDGDRRGRWRILRCFRKCEYAISNNGFGVQRDDLNGANSICAYVFGLTSIIPATKGLVLTRNHFFMKG